ncbi:unnamed protein product [Umbelopsis ramanniana]
MTTCLGHDQMVISSAKNHTNIQGYGIPDHFILYSFSRNPPTDFHILFTNTMRLGRKRPDVPTILSTKDAKILAQYKSRVEVFDRMFKCCCCWIGWDMLLDLIPVLGKTISLFFAIALYRLACSANISHEVKSKMQWHTTVNFVIGLIPIVGLIFDILYQANAKNLKIFEQFLYDRARTNSAQPLDASLAPAKSVSIDPTLV